MGGSARTLALTAVAVVATAAAPFIAPLIEAGLGTTALEIGGAVIDAGAAGDDLGAAIGILDTATSVNVAAAPVLAGVATGAAAGGASAAIQGTDVWQGAFQGAEAGAVGGAVSGAVGAVLPEGVNPQLAAGLKGAASGFTSSELKGKDLQTSLAVGATSGLTAAATSALFPKGFLGGDMPAIEYQTDSEGNPILDESGKPVETQASADARTQAKLSALAEKSISGLGGAYIGKNVSSLFTPSSPATAASGSTSSKTSLPTSIAQSPTPGGQQRGDYSANNVSYGGTAATGQPTTQGQPGSQALAQALRVGDPSNAGTSVESPSQGTGPDQNVWNTASLRFKDETGSDV